MNNIYNTKTCLNTKIQNAKLASNANNYDFNCKITYLFIPKRKLNLFGNELICLIIKVVITFSF